MIHVVFVLQLPVCSCGMSFVHKFGIINNILLRGCHIAGIAIINKQFLFLNLFYHGHFLLGGGVSSSVVLLEWSSTVFDRDHFTLALVNRWQNCLAILTYLFFLLIINVIDVSYRVEPSIDGFNTIECNVLILLQEARDRVQIRRRRLHLKDLFMISFLDIIAS